MRILITGVAGQIGSYLAELLVGRGDEVLGTALGNTLPGGVIAATGGLSTEIDVERLLTANGTLDAVVHLAGQASVGLSFAAPVETFETNAAATARIAFAAASRGVRLIHASSAEIFGAADLAVQDEDTPLRPVSPYGAAKAAAHLVVQTARRAFGAPATNIVFFVGESERRSRSFVFRKITRTIVEISRGLSSELTLGNIDVVRDFSHARDFARGVVPLLSAPPGDYVCGSGEGHTVRDVAEEACAVVGVKLQDILRIDRSLLRSADPPSLVANAGRLRSLGWRPEVSFRELVRRLVSADLEEIDGSALRDEPKR